MFCNNCQTLQKLLDTETKKLRTFQPGTGILDSESRNQDPGHKIHDLQ